MSESKDKLEHKKTTEQLDSSKNNSNWGGKRDGAGRPKGSMNEDTIFKANVKAAYERRVAENADRLFNSQFNLATGEQYLMCKRKVGKGASARTVTEVVDDPEIIKSFIDDTLDTGDDEWYFISTKPANNMAIDSMLDRSIGKAPQQIDLTNPDNSLSPWGQLNAIELRKLANNNSPKA